MREYRPGTETLARLGNIGRVLSKYGLPGVAGKLGLPKRRSFRKAGAPLSVGQKVRAILEELGPAYVKLGQALSCHPDVLPSDIVQELEKLQDKAGPFPFAQVEKTVAKTLKKPLKEVFTEFEPVPFAAASLSQVHRARLASGEKVAVKVQRPGLAATIRGDLDLMRLLARMLDKHVPELKIYDLPRLISEFERSIEKEIDFRLEADNYERFRANFADDPGVHFPHVHRKYSGRDVLTLEYIAGARIDSLLRSDTTHDRMKVAERGARAVLQQIFQDGFFHADPHKGNLIVMKDDVVCFIDAGMVGVLDKEGRDLLDRLLVASVARDVPALVSVIREEGMVPDDADLGELREDINGLFDRYYGADLENIDLAAGLTRFIGLVRKHRVRMPRNVMLLVRCLVILEGVGRQLDPGFNPVRGLAPHAQNVLRRGLAPSEIAGGVGAFIRRNLWAMKSFPDDLVRFLHRIVKGQAELKVDHRGLEEVRLGIERASGRLAGGVLTAGVIIASALIMKSGFPPLVRGFSLLGVLGYLVSLVFAAVTFVRMFKDAG